jgi:hypothetical protein
LNHEFVYVVHIIVKNDALTREAGRVTLDTMLAERLVRSVGDLPWVLSTDVIPAHPKGQEEA